MGLMYLCAHRAYTSSLATPRAAGATAKASQNDRSMVNVFVNLSRPSLPSILPSSRSRSRVLPEPNHLSARNLIHLYPANKSFTRDRREPDDAFIQSSPRKIQ